MILHLLSLVTFDRFKFRFELLQLLFLFLVLSFLVFQKFLEFRFIFVVSLLYLWTKWCDLAFCNNFLLWDSLQYCLLGLISLLQCVFLRFKLLTFLFKTLYFTIWCVYLAFDFLETSLQLFNLQRQGNGLVLNWRFLLFLNYFFFDRRLQLAIRRFDFLARS